MSFIESINIPLALGHHFRQWRLFWGTLWVSKGGGWTTVWLCLGGRKPGPSRWPVVRIKVW